jgi:ribonuclease BN (tRNA processing enzyme)
MKLIVLGSGTCVPSLERASPAYYLEAEEHQFLIDCGNATLLQLEKANKSYKDIDAVFISHTHPDHVSGISPLIHALMATPFFTREKDLFLVGPEGFKKYYSKSVGCSIGKPKSFSIHVIEIKDKMDHPPLHIFSRKTVHSKDSIAFRFEYGNKSLVITGDADLDKGIIELSKNADLLIADCSFPASMKTKGHMIPKECGVVAREAGVKKLLLSHIYTVPFPVEQMVEECRQAFNGDIYLAQDLMIFKL